MWVMLAGSLVLTAAPMAPAGVAAEKGPQLTSDQQSLVVLAVRTQLGSHAHGWTSATPVCLRLGLRDESSRRQAQVPKEVLGRLNERGRRVVPADQCVRLESEDTRGNRFFHFRDATGKQAVLLDVAIPKTPQGADDSVSVSLLDEECEPLACDATDVYRAQKTKGSWTLEYSMSFSD